MFRHRYLRRTATLAIAFIGASGGNHPPTTMAQSGGPTSSEERLRELESIAQRYPDNPAAVVAVVGQTPILAGEFMPQIDLQIDAAAAQSPTPIPEKDVRIAKTQMMRSLLAASIRNKMLRESFLLSQIGNESSDKRAEADERLQQKAREMFLESELPALKKQYKTEDVGEIDRRLRAKGGSLSASRRMFVDMMLGHLYIRDAVDEDPEISLSEIAQFYRAHLDDYQRLARARWEQLSVHFDRTASREAAEMQIRAMGREAYFGGSVAAVARRQSHDVMASQGGRHDWTDQGSLTSEIMDDKIFSLPLNRLSEIIENERGFHIIRVTDREPAGTIPLSEVQDDIRNQLKKQKITEAQTEALKSINHMVAVWTLFPEDVPGALPLPNTRVAAKDF